MFSVIQHLFIILQCQ